MTDPKVLELIAAVKEFIAKLEEVEPVINGMIGLNFARTGQQYRGPNYAKEKQILNAAIASVESGEEWIPASTPPEFGGKFLAAVRSYPAVKILWWSHEHKFWSPLSNETEMDVTHWMPIPKYPSPPSTEPTKV